MLRRSRYDRPVDNRPASPALGEAGKVVGSDISSRAEVRVDGVATPPTTKLRLRAPIGALCVATLVALLTCVAGIDVGYSYACQFRLVSQEHLQAIERPGVQTPALPLPALHAIANVCEVFKNYRGPLRNRIDDPSGQDVITILAEAVDPSAQFTQMPASRAGAFRLKGAAKPESPFLNLTPAALTKKLSIAGNCGSDDPKVYAYHLPGRLDGFKVLLHNYMEPETTLAVLDKISGSLFPVQPCTIDFRHHKADPKPALHGGEAGNIPVEPELTRACVVAHSARFRLRHGDFLAFALQRPSRGERLSRLDAGRADKLRLEIAGFPFGSIGLMVEFYPIDSPLRPANSADAVERLSVLSQRLIQRSSLLWTGTQPKAYGQGSHTHIVNREPTKVKGKRLSLQPPKGGGISARERT